MNFFSPRKNYRTIQQILKEEWSSLNVPFLSIPHWTIGKVSLRWAVILATQITDRFFQISLLLLTFSLMSYVQRSSSIWFQFFEICSNLFYGPENGLCWWMLHMHFTRMYVPLQYLTICDLILNWFLVYLFYELLRKVLRLPIVTVNLSSSPLHSTSFCILKVCCWMYIHI